MGNKSTMIERIIVLPLASSALALSSLQREMYKPASASEIGRRTGKSKGFPASSGAGAQERAPAMISVVRKTGKTIAAAIHAVLCALFAVSGEKILTVSTVVLSELVLSEICNSVCSAVFRDVV